MRLWYNKYGKKVYAMKCLIAYFSQTNSTRKIAESIGKELTLYDWEVDFKNIKYNKIENIKDYDLLGFGTPVYYYRLPIFVKDYLQSLPVLNNKPVFSFITYGSYFFSVPNEMNNILKEKNIVNLGFFAARGADKYLGYLKRGVLFSDGHPNKREHTQAKNFARTLLEYFQVYSSSENIYNYNKGTKKGLIYNCESLLTKRWLINNIYTRFFSSTEKCIGCGECVEECPQNNIILDSIKRPKWGNSCELCFICEMVCPVQAINSLVDMKVFQPMLKYNVKQGIKDNDINYTEIEYKNGEIIKSK